MNVLDLFSGIGAFSLGLERAGFCTTAFCEIDPYCRRVLAKHWPEVPCYDDVRSLTADRLRADGISVDVICGGFPCQDISVAGRGAGITGERSGLWREFSRLISEVGPRYVIVENVAALLGRGLGDVLGDLASLGYDAEWHCIPAAAVGAPHIRDRVWIVAYAQHSNTDSERSHRAPEQQQGGALELRYEQERVAGQVRAEMADADSGCGIVGDTVAGVCGSVQTQGIKRLICRSDVGKDVANANGSDGQRRGGPLQMGRLPIAREITNARDAGGIQWSAEPDVGRVAHGVASRVDRLRGLGNSLVPQIPELIGRGIIAASAQPGVLAA